MTESLEIFTLYSQTLDQLPDENMAELATGCRYTKSKDADGSPSYSYRWSDGLSVTCNVMGPTELAEHLRGFAGYVESIYKGQPDERGKQIIDRIKKTTLVIGIVVQPGRDSEGRAEELLGCMCGGLTPIMFYGDTLYDHKGCLLLAPDGSFDPTGEIWPEGS